MPSPSKGRTSRRRFKSSRKNERSPPSSIARLLDEGDGVVTEVPVRELVETLKNAKQTRAVVFDGIITQRILDIASEMNMHSIVGTKMGTITKQPAGVEVWTRSDLAP